MLQSRCQVAFLYFSGILQMYCIYAANALPNGKGHNDCVLYTFIEIVDTDCAQIIWILCGSVSMKIDIYAHDEYVTLWISTDADQHVHDKDPSFKRVSCTKKMTTLTLYYILVILELTSPAFTFSQILCPGHIYKLKQRIHTVWDILIKLHQCKQHRSLLKGVVHKKTMTMVLVICSYCYPTNWPMVPKLYMPFQSC